MHNKGCLYNQLSKKYTVKRLPLNTLPDNKQIIIDKQIFSRSRFSGGVEKFAHAPTFKQHFSNFFLTQPKFKKVVSSAKEKDNEGCDYIYLLF